MKDFRMPSFSEIRMDAEIGSYQEDGGEDRDPLFVEADATEDAEVS